MATPTEVIRVNWARKPAFEDLSLASTLGLVSYWRFSETVGTIAFDRQGGNHGTYTGGYTLGTAGILTGDLSTDVQLNGSTGWISVPSSQPSLPSTSKLDVADTFSLLAVVKRGNTGVKHQLFAKGANGPSLYIGTDDKLTLAKLGVADIVKSTTTLDTGTHVVGATKSGSTSALYIDGIDVTGTVTNQTVANTTSNLAIGQDGSSASWFSGILGEAQYWSVALTAAQMANLGIAALQGEFGGATDEIAGTYVTHFEQTHGASTDFSGEAIGEVTLDVDNPIDASADYWTPDRNLITNASFESGLDPWLSTGVTHMTQPATNFSLTSTAASGTYAAMATLSATSNSGVYHPLEGLFPAGVSVTASANLRSIAGSTAVEIGFASLASTANQARSSSTITTGAVDYTVTWQPSFDTSDAAFFVRTRTASAATVNIDKIQINAGSTAGTFMEAPTRPLLSPGAPIHAYASTAGTLYPQFYGAIERITPQPDSMTAQIVAYDPLKALAVPISDSLAYSTARDARYAVLDDAVRAVTAVNNLLPNGDFSVGTAGWTLTSATRVTTPSHQGSASLKIPGNGNASTIGSAASNLMPSISFTTGVVYTATFWAKLIGAADNFILYFGNGTFDGNYAITTGSTPNVPSPDATWRQYTITITMPTTTSTPMLGVVPTSGNSARGVYIADVMIVQGSIAPTSYIDFSAPKGRQTNYWNIAGYQSAEITTLWVNGNVTNMVANAEADTDTSGWLTTVDAFYTTALGTVSRITAGNYGIGVFATAFQFAAGLGGDDGAYCAITNYTFRANQLYTLYFDVDGGNTSNPFTIGIGSNGTPTDKSQNAAVTGNVKAQYVVSWTPVADRNDAHVFIKLVGTIRISGFVVVNSTSNYMRQGFRAPSAITQAQTISLVSSGVSHPKCVRVLTYARTGSGVVISSPLNQYPGGQYTATMKLRATSGSPTVNVVVGAPHGQISNVPVNWKTFTLSTTWLPFSVTFQGIAADTTSGNTVKVAVVTATNAAVTFEIDDFALTMGTAVQPFLVPEAAGVDQAESDIIRSYSIATTASSVLATLNSAFMGRHWYTAQMGRPWGIYNSFARKSLPAKPIAESYVDTTGDGIQGFKGFEKDRQTIKNLATAAFSSTAVTPGTAVLVTVSYALTASDATSIARYGLIPATVGDSSLVNGPAPGDTTAQDLLTLTLNRYKIARSRPVMASDMHFPQMLQRLPNDLLAVTYAREKLVSQRYLILSRRLTIDQSGLEWKSEYTLEEFVAT